MGCHVSTAQTRFCHHHGEEDSCLSLEFWFGLECLFPRVSEGQAAQKCRQRFSKAGMPLRTLALPVITAALAPRTTVDRESTSPLHVSQTPGNRPDCCCCCCCRKHYSTEPANGTRNKKPLGCINDPKRTHYESITVNEKCSSSQMSCVVLFNISSLSLRFKRCLTFSLGNSPLDWTSRSFKMEITSRV